MSLSSTIVYISAHPLSRGRRMRNIARFLGWQVASRLSLSPDSFEFVNSSRMVLRRGMTGASGNFYVGLHEFEEMALLLHLLRPDDLFVDVGANVGSYSVLAGAAIGADVLAFEPGAQARDWLMRNISLNGIGSRVDVRSEAVGAAVGKTGFTHGLDTVNHRMSGEVLADEVVPMTTLDASLAGRAATMIKIDVEGFECDVIAGARHALERPELICMIIELAGAGAQYGFDEAAIRRDIEALGFAPMHYDPFARALSPRDAADPHGNTIFIRNAPVAAQRLASAPQFQVQGRRI